MGVIIDDIRDKNGKWKRTTQILGVNYYTMSGSRWHDMVKRATSANYQRNRPTYVGCSLSEEFKDFDKFTDWHMSQVGYGIPKYALDKDILVRNNKVYSPQTCVLVPMQLNSFTLINRKRKFLLGVSKLETDKFFRATISIGGKTKNMGGFLTELDAHEAYKAAKEAEARRWYERLKAGEFIVDERVIERMRTWTLEGE